MLTISATQITCTVAGFDRPQIDSDTPYTATVTVNEVSDSAQAVTILPTRQSGRTVYPTRVSPVLATVLTVSLEETYPEVLDAADFTATLVD